MLSGHRGSSILYQSFVAVAVGIGSGFCAWHGQLYIGQAYPAAEKHEQSTDVRSVLEWAPHHPLQVGR